MQDMNQDEPVNYQYEYSDKIALPWVIKHLKPFLFPDLSRKAGRINKYLCGVVASLNKQPVGLILASFGKTNEDVRVHSFRVHPDHQNKGIGNSLLRQLEMHVASAGCKRIDGRFREHWSSVPALKKVLAKCGWTKPEKSLIIVKGKAAKVLKLFQDDQLELPEGFRFHPFTGLSAEQKQYIRQRKADEDWYPDILDPFVYERTINPVTSLALLRNDTVVGWVMSHLIAPNLNEFTSLFIDKDVRSYKLAHLLMRETIYRQHDHGIPDFLITSESGNYVMSRFLIRHAGETDVFFTTTYRTEKIIT